MLVPSRPMTGGGPTSTGQGSRRRRTGPGVPKGGLLAVDPGNGDPIHLFTPTGPTQIPLLLARPEGDHTVIIASDRPCEISEYQGHLAQALQQWASEWGRRLGVAIKGRAPSGWCSWFFRPSDTVRIPA